MKDIILCADPESLMHPEFLGLDGVELDSVSWLYATSDAFQARKSVDSGKIKEAWIMSTYELDGINLAAAICKDDPNLKVYLITNQASGSELSRATTAGIAGILTTGAFNKRFSDLLRVRSTNYTASDAVAASDSDEVLDETAPSISSHPAHPNIQPPAASNIHETQNEDGSKEICVDRKPKIPSDSDLQRVQSSIYMSSDPAKNTSRSNRGTNAFTISFFGGSGGVGKSTISSLCAYRAAKLGYRCVALDCDMQFGDLHQIMSSVPKLSIDDLLANPGEIARLSLATPNNTPALICAPDRLESSELLNTYIEELMGICSSEFDLIFVNTGASWEESHAQLLEMSAVSVFLIDQRVSSVHACRHALDLCMRLGIASASFVYALNKCKRGALFSGIDIANALQGAHVFEIRDGGMEVEEMLGAGLAQDLMASKNEICTSIDDMLSDLLPMTPARNSSLDNTQSFQYPERRRRRKNTGCEPVYQKSKHSRQKSRISK